MCKVIEELVEEGRAKDREKCTKSLIETLIELDIPYQDIINKTSDKFNLTEAEVTEFIKRSSARYEIIKELKEEGRVEGKQEIIQKMSLKGYSIEQIINITGCSKEEVEKGY